MKRLLLTLFLALAPTMARAGDIQTLVQLARESVGIGEPVALWLNYLNSGAQVATVSVPENLDCMLLGSAGITNAVATLKLTAQAGEVAVAPGTFVRYEFTLKPPADWSGGLRIVPAEIPGQHLMVLVEPMQEIRPKELICGVPIPRRITPETDPVAFFQRHFFPHEPMYFIAGTEQPNAKFQISFKYKLVAVNDPDSWWETLFIGYTQTSLWDLEELSAPFFDSSYKPEVLFSKSKVWTNSWLRLDLASGLQHESNGRDGADSRSLNIAYVRPTLFIGHETNWFFSLAPRGWGYLGDLTDNPDLADYRGYFDLRAVLGMPGGVQLATLLRAGKDFDKGSAQFDLTIPLWDIMRSPLFLQVQYFNGYGESLLNYNQREDQFRVGFGLFR